MSEPIIIFVAIGYTIMIPIAIAAAVYVEIESRKTLRKLKEVINKHSKNCPVVKG